MLALERATIARGERVLLRDLDLTFAPGTVTAILGANGAGKSSLLAALAGALPLAAGTIRLDGALIHALGARARARAIALVDPTEAVLSSLTVIEAVASARFPYHRWWEWSATEADDTAVEDALARTELGALRERELGTLSSGERQRVWIALAIAQRARVVLLDEPTSHLDLRHAVETLRLARDLAAGGALVVAALHHLEEAASFADRVVIIGDGGIAADGSPATAFTPEVIERAYGVRVGVDHGPTGLRFTRYPNGQTNPDPRRQERDPDGTF